MATSSDKWGELNRDKCLKILKGKDSRHLCNGNTYLVLDDDNNPAVKLWATNIITFKKDNITVLNTNGWQTVTTRNRLSRYCKYPVFSMNTARYHGWVVYHLDKHYRFEDCMAIAPDGCSTEPLEVEIFNDFTGMEVKNTQEMHKAMKSLDETILLRLLRNPLMVHDVIIGAPREFLPLLIGRVPENYQQVFERRLARGF